MAPPPLLLLAWDSAETAAAQESVLAPLVRSVMGDIADTLGEHVGVRVLL